MVPLEDFAGGSKVRMKVQQPVVAMCRCLNARVTILFLPVSRIPAACFFMEVSIVSVNVSDICLESLKV